MGEEQNFLPTVEVRVCRELNGAAIACRLKIGTGAARTTLPRWVWCTLTHAGNYQISFDPLVPCYLAVASRQTRIEVALGDDEVGVLGAKAIELLRLTLNPWTLELQWRSR